MLAAVAECKRVAAVVGVVPPDDVARITLLSSTFRKIGTVAAAYCDAVSLVAQQDDPAGESNRWACGEPVLRELIAVVKHHDGNAGTLESAYLALGNLLWSHSVLQTAAVRLGVVSLVLGTMARFPTNVNAQRGACYALATLVCNPTGRAAIAEGNGAPLVRAARAAYPANDSVQRRSKIVLDLLGES